MDLNEVSAKLSNIKSELSKICYPEKSSFARVQKYTNNNNSNNSVI